MSTPTSRGEVYAAIKDPSRDKQSFWVQRDATTNATVVNDKTNPNIAGGSYIYDKETRNRNAYEQGDKLVADATDVAQ